MHGDQNSLDRLGEISLAETEEPTTATSIVTYSVLGGLCPLIPVPFMDDVILGFIKKRQVATLCKSYGISPTDEAIKALTKEPSGCVSGCLFTAITYPVRKILKKVLFFLSIKSCVDVTSTMLHRGYLLNHCLQAGHITDANVQDKAAMVRVQGAIIAACKDVDPRPVNQALKRIYGASKALLRGGARSMWALFRKARKENPDREASMGEALDKTRQQEQGPLASLFTQVREEVWSQEGYVKNLVARFEEEISREG